MSYKNSILIDFNKLFNDSIYLFNYYFSYYDIIEIKDLLSFFNIILYDIKKKDCQDQIIIYDILLYLSTFNIYDDINNINETIKHFFNHSDFNIYDILNNLNNDIKYKFIFNIMYDLIKNFKELNKLNHIVIFFNNEYEDILSYNYKIKLLNNDHLIIFSDFIIYIKEEFKKLNYIINDNNNLIDNNLINNNIKYNSDYYIQIDNKEDKLKKDEILYKNDYIYNILYRQYIIKKPINLDYIKNIFTKCNTFYIDYLIYHVQEYNKIYDKYDNFNDLINFIKPLCINQITNFYIQSINNIKNIIDINYNNYIEYKKYKYNTFLITHKYSLLNIISYIKILKNFIDNNLIIYKNLINKLNLCIYKFINNKINNIFNYDFNTHFNDLISKIKS